MKLERFLAGIMLAMLIAGNPGNINAGDVRVSGGTQLKTYRVSVSSQTNSTVSAFSDQRIRLTCVNNSSSVPIYVSTGTADASAGGANTFVITSSTGTNSRFETRSTGSLFAIAGPGAANAELHCLEEKY